MHKVERELRKIYRYSKLNYVFDVYMECEYRANLTQEEYEGLQPGEFRFDYASWEKRLGYSHKQMIRAIQELTTKNVVIIQTHKGVKGDSSRYILTRIEEQKKAQNEEQNKERNKPSEIKGLKRKEEQKQERKEEQKTIHSSRYNNLDIESNNIYSDFVKRIIKIYPGKKIKNVRDKKLPKILNKYGPDEIVRCVTRYADEVKDQKDKHYILHESTFWNGRYIDYLDCNYEELKHVESNNKEWEEWNNE